MTTLSLIIPAIISGIFTFVAPCTLPLVPAYFAFISGVSLSDLKNPAKSLVVRRKIFFNGVLYTIGFSIIFILFGVLFALGGSLLSQYRAVLARAGGILVIFFGLFMLNIIRIPALDFLDSERQPFFARILKPGNPFSSLLFGAAFAFGWTPCVGPILGSVLTLAAATATVGQGALLLAFFSLGLALPFLIIAATVGTALHYLKKIEKALHTISIVGGVFLIVLGVLLVTNTFSDWTAIFYRLFGFIHFDGILNYL